MSEESLALSTWETFSVMSANAAHRLHRLSCTSRYPEGPAQVFIPLSTYLSCKAFTCEIRSSVTLSRRELENGFSWKV